ncbi:DUF3298 domain-containing protein [Clostridium sp.]|uniref:DUF3298 and DUF4163 domain-containing protein n=1 Tax=Clostridium sp. TaxID=1506 RepID=UPI00321772F9
MFIRKPYNTGSPYFRSDEYLDSEDVNFENLEERFMPSLPNTYLPGQYAPPNQDLELYHKDPSGKYTPPGQQTPKLPGGPPGAPPNITPKSSNQKNSNLKSVSPGSIKPCIYQFVYIWLNNGNSFWAWLTNVDYRTASGFRWTGWRWVYFGVDLRKIDYFNCYGRSLLRAEDNVVSNLKTQVLSPPEFKLQYPFIEGIKDENVANIINQEIIRVLNSLFLTHVLIPEKVDFAKVESAYEIPLNSSGLISIVFSLYTHVKGEKSGHTTFASITADLNTGEIYEFDDLFNPKMDYRRGISNIAMQTASQMDTKFIMPYKGVTDPQHFYLTPEGIVLYYQIDEFTPKESGLFRITIPYNEIISLLYPGSPLAKLTPMYDADEV